VEKGAFAKRGFYVPQAITLNAGAMNSTGAKNALHSRLSS